ncbi:MULTISPECIES: Hsp70 family protein [unclassified Actinomyces]|uniref:Hsp70 family protein n=1 Tax=unclassified Actinomyces TaxID=2609248 RepID=UPI0013A6D982|nr:MULTISPECIES: Hsp70 family protein [unclassified Actinomyces]MBW3070272.1 Hsp70 family protein [Actinomyces sp. 594]NDR52660.1 Hsp70 family protein [Actinomyces sp. 565]
MAARSGSRSGSNSTRQVRKRRRVPSAPLDLGIDLGTTRTVVSRADRGNYPVIGFTDTEGDIHEFFPSLTALTADGLVHGFEARAAARRGAPLLRSLKRLLSSPTVTAQTPVQLGDATFTIAEILTDYLITLRNHLLAADALEGADPADEDAHIAVAVPAHAYGAQRLITLDAFRAAGFHVTAMLNEPSAAGFEYTHRKSATVSSRRTRVLVYDLGGGTFDTSLVDVRGHSHEVLASRGVGDLGGDDLDLLLAQLSLQRAGLAEEELTTRELDDLLDQCRDVKEAMAPQTRRLVIILRGKDVVLPAADFYSAATPLIERSLDTMAPLIGRLDDGGPDLAEIAGIYLVGGASSFPLVPRLLRERFGRRVHRSPYPGASTAIGLAIAADRTAAVALTDRLSRGFGVFREADGGARTVFDALLTEESVQERADGAHGTVITRSYPAVHNIGRFRYVECAGVDDAGEPRGQLAPYEDVLFPFDRSLRDVEDLMHTPVHRLGSGPVIEERYDIDGAGLIRVTLTDLSDGYSRTYVLGRRTA